MQPVSTMIRRQTYPLSFSRKCRKKVQNKIHYAVHGETAAVVIFHRADAEKEFMGLKSSTKKNLRAMGQIVSGYLDFAERQAEREQIMTMRD